MDSTMIESVRIRGFRSLADVELAGIPKAAVLIGANGSGKSNFIRFFEMLSWMLEHRRLAEFIGSQGGADDQLHGGSRRTPRIEAEVRLRIDEGYGDYRFMLSRAQPDRSAAIALVGGMIKSLAEDRQVIVATQSPLLVDAFGLDEIFVLELRDGRTEVRKLSPDDYQVWLDDNFTPGELWQKNLLGGRP